MAEAGLSERLGDEVRLSRMGTGTALPVFVEPATVRLQEDAGEVAAWFVRTYPEIRQLLSDAGAVVLRGFPMAQTSDFERLVEPLPPLAGGYSGGNAPRKAVKGRVMQSTARKASMVIPLHQEMAYLPQYPSQLAFYCLQPSETGGETIVGDMRQLQKRLPARLLEGVKASGLRYIRNFRAADASTGSDLLDNYHRTWPDVFGTDDRAEVEASCRDRGLDHAWGPDGSVTIVSNVPGLVEHPVTGELVWFTQIQTMSMQLPFIDEDLNRAKEAFYPQSEMTQPYDVRFGDGSTIPPEDIAALGPLLDEVTVGFPWRHGDVMFVDNILTAHGRNPFTGSRDVQVALFQ